MTEEISQALLQTLEQSAPMLGILITTLVSIVAIRKTAEANRVSNVHNEMLQCIIVSMVGIRKISILLDGISRNASYFSFPGDKLIETAYDRYWREIQIISNEFNINQSRQLLVLPKPLYEKMQKLIDKLNEARNEAKDLKSNGNNEKLREILKEINSLYVDFVHETRVYVGVDALKPFSIRKENILGIEEAD